MNSDISMRLESKKPSPIIVQQGKLLDFIDGITQRDETPEEYVRQEIAKSLVREYGYDKSGIAVEFTLRLGSKKPRADLIVFFEDVEHAQGQAYIIIECKTQNIKPSDRKDGVGQLQSYMSACPNATLPKRHLWDVDEWCRAFLLSEDSA